MGGEEEVRQRLQHMREKARELTEAAEDTADPREQRRLREKARDLESRTEQESGMRSGDIYPME